MLCKQIAQVNALISGCVVRNYVTSNPQLSLHNQHNMYLFPILCHACKSCFSWATYCLSSAGCIGGAAIRAAGTQVPPRRSSHILRCETMCCYHCGLIHSGQGMLQMVSSRFKQKLPGQQFRAAWHASSWLSNFLLTPCVLHCSSMCQRIPCSSSGRVLLAHGVRAPTPMAAYPFPMWACTSNTCTSSMLLPRAS